MKALEHIKATQFSAENLLIPDDVKVMGKYNDFVPSKLLRKQYVDRFIDIAELQKEMNKEL